MPCRAFEYLNVRDSGYMKSILDFGDYVVVESLQAVNIRVIKLFI
jgi:hypothetical protein